MNQEQEKIVYIEVEKIVYVKKPIPEYQKRARKNYIESEKGRIQSRKNQKAYYDRKKLKKLQENNIKNTINTIK
jgi:uncharacterized protein (UPF0216 family)